MEVQWNEMTALAWAQLWQVTLLIAIVAILTRLLGRNRPWLVMIGAAICTLASVAVRGAVTVHYFKYYVGDDGTPLFLIFDKTAVFLSLQTFALLAGILITQAMVKRFDKRRLMIFLTLGNAAAMAVFMSTPSTPCSMVMQASEAVPTPASTITGTRSLRLISRM